MNGVKLACRYAYPTTKLGYCGPKKFSEKIYKCAREGVCKGVPDLLMGYEALPIYLKAIATFHRLEPLDKRVVESFWLGNRLSSSLGTSEIEEAFEPLMRSSYYSRKLGPKFDALPDDCHPTHSFHVLIIGSITGVLGSDLGSLTSCLARPAKVLDKGVDTVELVKTGDKADLRATTQQVRMDFVDAHAGDLVSVHWGYAAQLLDSRMKNSLEQDIQHHLDIRNSLSQHHNE